MEIKVITEIKLITEIKVVIIKIGPLARVDIIVVEGEFNLFQLN